MPRPPANRSTSGEPDPDESTPDRDTPDTDEPETDAEVSADDDGDPEGEIERTAQANAFWAKAGIDPVEVALPSGAGYTLRAYRMSSEITPSDYTAREDDTFPDRSAAYADDEDFDDAEDLDELEETEDEEDRDGEDRDDESEGDEGTEDKDAEDEEPSEEDFRDEAPDEEVPVFLSQGGHLLLFRTRAGLVEFVTSDAEHDLTQLEGWSSFVAELRPEHLVPLDEDTYELDLVVQNLRAGHESWDPDLILQCGQLARDLGHALRIESVVTAMSSGSPLDDVDEVLRSMAGGGVGAFFSRRKAKKIGTETASIGWRTVIGKISAVVDWRD